MLEIEGMMEGPIYTRSHNTYTSYVPELHYHIYKNKNNCDDSKLLLLHGIRLAGLETWDGVVQRLDGWSEILVPDLPGVGTLNPMNKTTHDFNLDILLESLVALIEKHRWSSFDICGLSYGGFLSMMLAKYFPQKISHHFIIESALLVTTPERLPRAGKNMQEIMNLVKEDVDLANQKFSELVSGPKRRFSLKASIRPIHNALGFTNLLNILVDVYLSGEIWSIIDAQKSVTALITEYAPGETWDMIECIRKRYPWEIVTIDNADHSVVFTNKPLIANILNQWFMRRVAI